MMNKTTNQPGFVRRFFLLELFLVRTRFFATAAGDVLAVGTLSKSSSVKSITAPSLSTGPPLSLSAERRSVVEKQPLIVGGLTGGDGERLETETRDSGKGPRKNVSNVTDDKSYFLITSSCDTVRLTVRIQ